MTTCLGKSCSFGLPRVPFVNCCQFMYLVIFLLVLRAGCGIWLYQFLTSAYPFTLDMKEEICSNLKHDINKLVDARNNELEDIRRRETNITLFNVPEQNLITDHDNKMAEEADVNRLCICLGLETPKMIIWFRLGKKALIGLGHWKLF